MNELLSALLDGELSARERADVLEQMRHNIELRRAWQRYHVIRAAVRHELDAGIEADIAGRVAARIALEDAPRTVRVWHWRPAARAVGGLAMAAGVAGLAIVGLRFSSAPSMIQPASSLQVASLQVSQVASPALQPAADRDAWRAQLNTLLVQHNEFAPAGINSVMSYVRVAGSDRHE